MRPLASMPSNMPEDGASTCVSNGDTERRGDSGQLYLRYDGSESSDEAAWGCMLQMIRDIVNFKGLKQVAFDLDISPSQLSHCLNERERHNIPWKWAPYIIKNAPDDKLVAFMALLRGRKLAPAVELTPEQKLERIMRTLGEQFGDDVRRVLLDKAFGK